MIKELSDEQLKLKRANDRALSGAVFHTIATATPKGIESPGHKCVQ